MIHIAIGTKAQYIKMVPIMLELGERKIDFNLIDLGQHSLITEGLRKEFGLKDPDVVLSSGQNISSLGQGLAWMFGLFKKGLDSAWVKENVFKAKDGVCLVHGDTVSTLCALYLAKRAKIKVAHVEAGLRSYNILEPFPEELIRLIAMRFSDILFSPSDWAQENLKNMGLASKTVPIKGNTSLESTFYSLNKPIEINLDVKDFALVTTHRMENIFSLKRLTAIVDLIERISSKNPVVFVQHPPTLKQLKKFALLQRLENLPNIKFHKILSHRHFVHLIDLSQFVITDGGSIQEEAFYLNKPCLLLRSRTERMEGIGQNVVVSGLDQAKIEAFLKNYPILKADAVDSNLKPSKEIVDYLLNIG